MITLSASTPALLLAKKPYDRMVELSLFSSTVGDIARASTKRQDLIDNATVGYVVGVYYPRRLSLKANEELYVISTGTPVVDAIEVRDGVIRLC